MFCSNCGKQVSEGVAFCSYCGSKMALKSGGINSPVQEKKSFGESSPSSGAQNNQSFTPFGTTNNTGNVPTQNPFANPQNTGNMSSQNPFGAYEYEKKPFETAQSTNGMPSQNPFGAAQNSKKPEEQMPISVNEKAKEQPSAKKEKAVENKGNTKPIKLVIMGLAQIVLVGIVCYVALSGKINDKFGNINVGVMVTLIGIVMLVEALLYLLLFTTKKKKELAPPPIENYKKRDVTAPPRYMNDLPETKSVEASSNTGAASQVNQSFNFSSFTSGEGQFEAFSADEEATMVEFPDEDDATVVMEVEAPKYPKLEYLEDGIKKEVIINKEEFIIGRLHGRVDFITSNKKIGRIHAAIVQRDGNYYVKDFNSQNKTYINRGGAINPEREELLHDNDIISFADSEFVFKLPV